MCVALLHGVHTARAMMKARDPERGSGKVPNRASMLGEIDGEVWRSIG